MDEFIQQPKQTRITNKNYLKFLIEGQMDILNEEDIEKVIAHAMQISRYPRESKALITTLYYTGARPAEVLLLLSNSFELEGSLLKIQFDGKIKKTKARPIRLSMRKQLIKDLWQYVRGHPPNSYIFYHFKGSSKRPIIRRGMPAHYEQISYKLLYHFKRWTSCLSIGNISPYYLRHNRWSKAAESGFTDTDMKFLKGGGSIDQYTHLSTNRSKKLASKIN